MVPFDSRRPGVRNVCRAPAALFPFARGLEGGYFHRAELQSAVLCLIQGQGQIATVDQTVPSHRWLDGSAWANFHSSAWSDLAGRRGTNSGFTVAAGLGRGARGRGGGVWKWLKLKDRYLFSNSVNGFCEVARNGDRALWTEPAGGIRFSRLF